MLGKHLIAKTKFGPAYFVRFQFLERSKILKDADVSFFRFFLSVYRIRSSTVFFVVRYNLAASFTNFRVTNIK